ncbi:neuraminidase-like domain-containing protein, partial [Frankia sp. CiP1_Cm_nod2]|uniref:neuraminidase-like domain-containing protein n=1 Tax=Frankia sp. CiP1_Cm_nod2 TaxID=2897161 RepID=UPI002023DA26
ATGGPAAAEAAQLAAVVVDACHALVIADRFGGPVGVCPAILDATADAAARVSSPPVLVAASPVTLTDRLTRLFNRPADTAAVAALAALAAGTAGAAGTTGAAGAADAAGGNVLTLDVLAAGARQLALAAAVGATVAECRTWATATDLTAAEPAAGGPAPADPAAGGLAAADAVLARVESRFAADQWASTGASILDGLRARRRDALVSFLVHRDRLDGADALSARLLVDVLIGPQEITTRIRQALNSVQMFVQRCELGREGPGMRPDAKADEGWSQWVWMGRYRVWEAQRRIFTHTENYADPAARIGRSSFFAELESDLLQSGLTDDAAEEAFRAYLDKLEKIARPQVLGFHRERVASTALGVQRDVLHVVARSGTAPYTYYYRTLDDGAWSPWEVIPVDIGYDQVVPVVWNRRLLLFWPVVTPDPDVPSSGGGQTGPRRLTEVQVTPQPPPSARVLLAWTERRHGKWLPKQLSDAADGAYVTVGRATGLVGLRLGSVTPAELVIAVTTPPPALLSYSEVPVGRFRLRPAGLTAEAVTGTQPLTHNPPGMVYRRGRVVGASLVVGSAPSSSYTLLAPGRRLNVTVESASWGLDVGSDLFVADADRTFFAAGGRMSPLAVPKDWALRGAGVVLPAQYHALRPGEAEELGGIRPGDDRLAALRAVLGDAAVDALPVPLYPAAGTQELQASSSAPGLPAAGQVPSLPDV